MPIEDVIVKKGKQCPQRSKRDKEASREERFIKNRFAALRSKEGDDVDVQPVDEGIGARTSDENIRSSKGCLVHRRYVQILGMDPIVFCIKGPGH